MIKKHKQKFYEFPADVTLKCEEIMGRYEMSTPSHSKTP